MFEFEIEMNIQMFLGILDCEKEEKNDVSILINYICLNDTPDYSDIHRMITDIAESRKWGFMEELARELYDGCMEFENIETCSVSITKNNPPKMENSRVSIRYNG